MRFTELKAMSLFMGLCVNESPSNSLCHEGEENAIRDPRGSSGGTCARVVLTHRARNGFPLLLAHPPFTLQSPGRAAKCITPDISHLAYDMITAASNSL